MGYSRWSYSALGPTYSVPCLASVPDSDVRVEGIVDQFVLAVFVIPHAGVEVEESGADPKGEGRGLAGEEQLFGPVHNLGKFAVEFLMFSPQVLRFFRELRSNVERLVEIAVGFFECKVECELVPQLAEPVDEVPAHAGVNRPGAAVAEVGKRLPQLLIDFFDFLEERRIDRDGRSRS